jgi:hypothetical protein
MFGSKLGSVVNFRFSDPIGLRQRRNIRLCPPTWPTAAHQFEHVVYVRIFLTDFEHDYAAFNQLYTDYFRPDRLPARTTVGVTHFGAQRHRRG